MTTTHNWIFYGFFQNANHYRCRRCGIKLEVFSNVHPSKDIRVENSCFGSPVGTIARSIIQKAAARIRGVLT